MKAQKNSKVYWSLLKNFLNNKKIPIIPLLFYKNRFITDFQEKVKLFKFFFSKQCCIIPDNSSLLLISTILLTIAYLQLHFQPKILEKSFQILIQTKPMNMITQVSAC